VQFTPPPLARDTFDLIFCHYVLLEYASDATRCRMILAPG
jgi:hypothetical protein